MIVIKTPETCWEFPLDITLFFQILIFFFFFYKKGILCEALKTGVDDDNMSGRK